MERDWSFLVLIGVFAACSVVAASLQPAFPDRRRLGSVKPDVMRTSVDVTRYVTGGLMQCGGSLPSATDGLVVCKA